MCKYAHCDCISNTDVNNISTVCCFSLWHLDVFCIVEKEKKTFGLLNPCSERQANAKTLQIYICFILL